MRTIPNKPETEPAPPKPANAKPPDIASASIPDTLASLKVNPETGLAHAEVDLRRKEHGYNEVAEIKGHPILKFLGKFWGVSAWMLSAAASKPVDVTPEIAKRAYALYEQRGRRDGRAVQDWERAEQELQQDERHK